MISLPSFAVPLPGAWSSIVRPLYSSIFRPILILPTECFPSLSVIPKCPPPPSGSLHLATQWPPGGSQSRQVSPGSIHNANQAVIEEAARFARPRAVQYIVIKLLYFSTMYISSITGGAQAYECFYKPPPIY